MVFLDFLYYCYVRLFHRLFALMREKISSPVIKLRLIHVWDKAAEKYVIYHTKGSLLLVDRVIDLLPEIIS